MRVTIPLLLISLASCATAPASPALILRYHEVTDSEFVLHTPRGDVTIVGEHDVVIALQPLGADSAHAWYESAEVASLSPMEQTRPDLQSVLGELFVLRFDDEGHVETLATPEFPETLEGVTDLRLQFVDFFMPRPPEALRPGLAWTDSLTRNDELRGGASNVTRKSAVYEVVADTMVAGRRMFLVRGTVTMESNSSGPVANQDGVSVHVRLRGPEHNSFLIDAGTGRMVARHRSAELKGTMKYEGLPQPVEIDVTRSYSNEIELVDDGADGAHGQQCPAEPELGDTIEVDAVVRYLSGPALAGRGTGTVGDYCTARFVARALEHVGLEAGTERGFIQPVPLRADWPHQGEPATAQNVVGMIPGRDSSAAVVLVGAHHDHLGLDAEDDGEVVLFPGADDNASGVAALLKVAERMARMPQPRRTVVFVTFTGEETFWQGSRHYLGADPFASRGTRLMVNLDMVGRLEDGPVQVSGLATTPDSASIVSVLEESSVPVLMEGPPDTGSDHRRFHAEGVPVLAITTGTHEDHHEATDTPDKIDVNGVSDVAGLVARVVARVSAR